MTQDARIALFLLTRFRIFLNESINDFSGQAQGLETFSRVAILNL